MFSFLLIVLIVVITACGSSDDNNGNNAADNGDNNAAENGDNNGNGETTADGEEIYKGNCMTCHGDEGQGTSGPALKGDDFAADHDNVVKQVKEGGGGMPAFEDQLSEDEIDAVAKYITDEIE